MRILTRASWLILAGLLGTARPDAHAQELFFVTGTSRPGAAGLEPPGAAALDLVMGRSVIPGLVRVGEGAQLMLFESTGVVAVVLGPATLGMDRDEFTAGVRMELRGGRLLLASARGAGEGTPIVVLSQAAADPRIDVELPVEPGHTFVMRDDRGVAVGYVAEVPGGSIAPRVNRHPIGLASGQLMTVVADASPEITPLGDWVTQQGFGAVWGHDLGIASAQFARPDVEMKLFHNITAWDRYAAAGYVGARLHARGFNPEIRQTVQTITMPMTTGGRGAVIRTEPFPGANAVPVVSPAAASVQDPRNVGQGVTAIQLNSRAAQLLQASGSQGLGFQGLQRLAVPGFSQGVRTPGPAGLGAPQP